MHRCVSCRLCAVSVVVSSPSPGPRRSRPRVNDPASRPVCRRGARDERRPQEPKAKKVFIKTFGCQMNEYDSDKMADVLHAAAGLRAHRPTSSEADLILFNTCSVREKAQEKVFSDLGRVKHLKAQAAC